MNGTTPLTRSAVLLTSIALLGAVPSTAAAQTPAADAMPGNANPESAARWVLEGAAVGYLGTLALADDLDEGGLVDRAKGVSLLAGAGAVLGDVLVRSVRPATTSTVITTNVGQDWALAHGLLLPLAVQARGCTTADVEDGRCIADRQLRMDLGLAAAASLAGGAAATLLTPEMQAGQASFIGSASLWAGAAAWFAGKAIKVDADESDETLSLRLGITLAAADAAMVTAFLGRSRVTADRSSVMALDGLCTLGGGLGWLVGEEADEQTRGPLIAAGIGAGVLVWALWPKAPANNQRSDRHSTALLSWRDGHFDVGMPRPQLMPVTQGFAAGLSLLGGTN